MENQIELSTDSFSLRTHRPEDMERIVARHGEIYAQEYGWNKRFAELVTTITTDFINHYDPTMERFWIAEHKGEFLGCVALVNDRASEKTAKLRLLLVEKSARGLGLGRALVRQCTRFARSVGYSRIRLWTFGVLTSARVIYESEGYRLVQEGNDESFGVKLNGQVLELKLSKD